MHRDIHIFALFFSIILSRCRCRKAKHFSRAQHWRFACCRADNEFPVPVLTAIGELDGGGISYLRREWEETEALTEVQRLFTKTILVPQVLYIDFLRHVITFKKCMASTTPRAQNRAAKGSTLLQRRSTLPI